MAGENPLSYAFWAGTPSNSPLSYQALQTRRKIAEQLMGKNSPFPKNVGEGLTYAGEQFANAINMNRLDAEDRASQAETAKFLGAAALPGVVPPSGAAAGGVENTAVAPAMPPTSGGGSAMLPTPNSTPLEAGTKGSPLENAPASEGGYNYLDAAALAGGYGPRFRTERNPEVGNRVGFDKAIQGINPEMQARMMAAYNAMPDDVKKDFVYNEGSRPRAYQQYLYDTRSGRGLVAPPGSSRHETGEAVDVDRSPALDWLKANGAQFGLGGIPGDYPHVQMARGGRQFLDPNNPATLPIPGQSAVPPMPPGSRDAMASAIVNPSPPGSMVNTPAPLSGGTATPDMLAPGGFTQPAAPIRMAALTPQSGVASDAGRQAALPPQTPLDPANNPAIPSPITLAPPAVRTPGVQTAQAQSPFLNKVPGPLDTLPPEKLPAAERVQTPPIQIRGEPVAPNKNDIPLNQYQIRGRQLLIAAGDHPLRQAAAQQLIDYGNQQHEAEFQQQTKNYEQKKELYKQQEDKVLAHNLDADKRNEQVTELRIKNYEKMDQLAELKRRGGVTPTQAFEVVKESYKDAASIPGEVAAIRNAQGVLLSDPKMFTGSAANIQLSMNKLLAAAGWPLDPRVPATEQFQAYVKGVYGRLRPQVIGSGPQANQEGKVLEKAAAGDITMEPKSINAVLNSIYSLNIMAAKEHQNRLNIFTGDDPRAQQYAATFALPMHDIVPDTAVRLLREHYKQNPKEAIIEFNKDFRTLGLAQKILGLGE